MKVAGKVLGYIERKSIKGFSVQRLHKSATPLWASISKKPGDPTIAVINPCSSQTKQPVVRDYLKQC